MNLADKEQKFILQLFEASSQGQPDRIDHLLSKVKFVKKDLQKACYEATCLAVKNGHIEVIERILQSKVFQGAHKQQLLENMPDLIYEAVLHHDIDTAAEIIDTLAACVATSSAPRLEVLSLLDSCGYSALHQAAQEGNLEAAKRLLRFGADNKQKTRDGNTTLSIAIVNGHQDFWEYVLPLSEVNTWDDDHDTPLIFASMMGEAQLVEELVNLGANSNIVNKYGTTALWNAVYSGSEACVKILLKSNADLRICCAGTQMINEPELENTLYIYPSNKSLLWVACDRYGSTQGQKSSYLRIIALLLSFGLDVTKEKWMGQLKHRYKTRLPSNILNESSLMSMLHYFYTRPQRLQELCRNCLRYYHIDNAVEKPYPEWVSTLVLNYPLTAAYLTCQTL